MKELKSLCRLGKSVSYKPLLLLAVAKSRLFVVVAPNMLLSTDISSSQRLKQHGFFP